MRFMDFQKHLQLRMHGASLHKDLHIQLIIIIMKMINCYPTLEEPITTIWVNIFLVQHSVLMPHQNSTKKIVGDIFLQQLLLGEFLLNHLWKTQNHGSMILNSALVMVLPEIIISPQVSWFKCLNQEQLPGLMDLTVIGHLRKLWLILT